MNKVISTVVFGGAVLFAAGAFAAEPLSIARQGFFSAGGVTLSTPGTFDPIHGQFKPEGQTHHADHAHVFYQVPANGSARPIVFLHGFGQSFAGWQSTPDGREGWSDLFLRKGYSVYLVDQPRRRHAGQTSVASPVPTGTQDQGWYTQFRIGLWPNAYEGSQFPHDEQSLDQFFRQMTPNTGDFDMKVITAAMAAVFEKTGPGVLVAHSQGGRPAWDIALASDNVRAIVAVEPGGGFPFPEGEVPEAISTNFAPVKNTPVPLETFKKLVSRPIIFYFGDYIPDEPVEIPSRDYWRGVMQMAYRFAEAANRHGGDCTVVHLPKIGMFGNDHFIFQDKNNAEVADHLAAWLKSKGLD